MYTASDRVHPGMKVRTSDHHRLGHVTRCWDDYFEVRRGVLYEHVWMVPTTDVARASGREVELGRPRDEVTGVLAGLVLRAEETPERHAANDEVQHFMNSHRL